MARTQKDFTPAELEAAGEYLARRDRETNPKGKFDQAQRWFPVEEEVCECCRVIRAPSRSYPYSFLLHCRTAAHVANLFGVEVRQVRLAARLLETEE